MERISERMRQRSKNGGAAFIAYITAGDPDLAATSRYVRCLERAGTDIVELGVPFSDPVADGPTNQKAAERALKNGTSLADILLLVKKMRVESVSVPIVLFSYFNPILKYGLEKFATDANAAGVNGVLIVDLPPEEATQYVDLMKRTDVETIFLASPTTSSERIKEIEKASTGFIYYVSRTGVTGTEKSPSQEVGERLQSLKKIVSKPIGVGFGISTPETARAVASEAEGVIVGSALVNIIAQHKDTETIERELFEKTSELANAAHQEEVC